MPTYSYACTACEHRFDTKQSFTDPSLTDCPECAGRLRKLFAPVGVVFKGSGFYRTDSRSAPPSESGSADKSKPDAKPETKSDAKADAKSGTKADTKSGSSSSGSSSTSSGANGTSGSSSAKSSSATAGTS